MLNYPYDPQQSGVQYLEDLACAYWNSEVVFTAVELELFTWIGSKQKTLEEISTYYHSDQQGMKRFIDTLRALGLLEKYGDFYYNSTLALEYLIKGKEMYQGDSILWRKELDANWKTLKETLLKGKRLHYTPDEDGAVLKEKTRRYIRAMDCIARSKAKELVKLVEGLPLRGKLLDVGAGSGAFSLEFIEHFPSLKATLLDLSSVIDITRENISTYQKDICYQEGNILEGWKLGEDKFDVILLSNILHAYSENEVIHILQEASKWVAEQGYIIIHDFFMEHYWPKGQLSDLNMLVNTYNGKVFEAQWVSEILRKLKFQETGLIPLESDTGVIAACKSQEQLEQIPLDKKAYLMGKLKNLGFIDIKQITAETVVLTESAEVKCQFGCQHYGSGKCPPNSLSIEKMKALLKEYNYGLLLEGEPPTGEFQKKMLSAEKEAYQQGFYKAFSLWAGPCSLCKECNPQNYCTLSRPSMEGSGIDVFETVKRVGTNLKTLKNKNEYVKYFGLLLLE